MQVYAGTSGFSYGEWRGAFYPAEIKDTAMLRYYSTQLPAVEINNTFYRMPKSAVLAKWAADVPANFRFVIKASRRITHFAKLVDTGELIGYLQRSVSELGDKLGPLLFQLPKFLRADQDLLGAFLGSLPPPLRAVVEFGHDSWNDAATDATLRAHDAARCHRDDGDGPPLQLTATTDFGYLRLRRPGYDAAALREIHRQVEAMPWESVYVFFKHEDAANGPLMARRFLAAAAAST